MESESVSAFIHAVQTAVFFRGEETYSLAHMMDILEEQEEDKVFQNKKDAVALVHDWLKPSEDLYGMVDWEKNLCDFQELIFAGYWNWRQDMEPAKGKARMGICLTG